MADKTLHSLKFPGLSDIYKIPEITSEYNTSSTYAVGDYVTKDGKTYKCTTAIASGETWTAAHWTEVKIGKDLKDQVSDVKSAFDGVTKTSLYGIGYGIRITDEFITSLNISGNLLTGSKIKKCKKNLFNASYYTNKNDYIANAVKSHQPYLPIFVKPNTKYRVTFIVSDRTIYDNASWSDKQWVSNDPNTLSNGNGIASDFSNVHSGADQWTVTITSSDSGCLYFVNVWNKQAMLDTFFSCVNVLITEKGAYDTIVYAAYDGVDVDFTENVSVGNYENLIIHRSTIDPTVQNSLPEATIQWSRLVPDVDSQIERVLNVIDAKQNEVRAELTKVPLYVDAIADYNWVSTYEISAFSADNQDYADGTTDGNNGYFEVSGTAGNNYVAVGSGGNADLSVLTGNDLTRWLGCVLVDDDGNVSPCNVFYKSATELYIYPPLKDDIVSGQIGNMKTGIHLSKRGYKGYAQHLWNINPKHCEKSRYIEKYRVGDEVLPFTVYGGKVYATVDTRNVVYQYQSKFASKTYILDMTWGSAQFHNTETGIEWSVNIDGKTGYFEAYVGYPNYSLDSSGINTQGDAYNFDYESGAEIHCDLYVDDVLVDSYVKSSKVLERVCLDFADGTTAKVKIYSNKWQETNYGFSLGSMTWWVNEKWTDPTANPFTYKAITQLFDSWGDFQGQEVQKELEALHQSTIGTPIPINNKSRRNMTSQWGRLWFYNYVQSYNPIIMLTDFGINDYNSQNTTFPDEVAPDNTTWPVHFTKSTYAESMSKLITMATKNNITPVVVGIGWRDSGGQNAYNWMQDVIDALAVKV